MILNPNSSLDSIPDCSNTLFREKMTRPCLKSWHLGMHSSLDLASRFNASSSESLSGAALRRFLAGHPS